MTDLRPRPMTTPASSVTARLALARDVAQALLGSLDAEALARSALAHLGRLVPSDGARVLVHDRRVRADRVLAGAPLPLPAPVDLCATFDAAGSGELPSGAHLDLGRGDDPLVGALREAGVAHAMATPLHVRGKAFGLLLVDRQSDDPFHADDLAAMAEVAGPLSLALDNARLHQELSESFVALRDAQAELVRRERLAAVGTMAAVMAHEVRTPLAVMFNAIASLRRIGAPDEDARVLLRILDEEAVRLESLMNDLLEFGRPTRRAFSEVDVWELVTETLDGVRRDPRVPSTVELSLLPRCDVGAARWDAQGVRMALANLVLNASQAIGSSRKRGRVRVGAGSATPDVVRVTVEDDGPGIPHEVRRRMFEPFVTTRPKGMGLGLAVVRRAVDDHSGDLVISDGAGAGTRFELVLPRRPSAG